MHVDSTTELCESRNPSVEDEWATYPAIAPDQAGGDSIPTWGLLRGMTPIPDAANFDFKFPGGVRKFLSNLGRDIRREYAMRKLEKAGNYHIVVFPAAAPICP